MNPTLAVDDADAGQALLAVASQPSNAGLYAVRVTKPDGALRCFQMRVFGMPETIGAANSMITAAPVLEINTAIVKVSSNGTTAPAFTTQPSISPSTGSVGTTFTASNGAASDATSVTRRWLLNGSQIGTGTTVTPNAAGSLTLEVTATGSGGSSPTTSNAVTVAAALPTLTIGGPLTFASGAAAGTLVATIGNVPTGATPTLTPNDGRLAIAGDATNGWKVVVGLTVANAGTIALAVAAAGAPGVSATVQVGAVGADEVVISPAVTTQRSTYAFNDAGVIQRKPAGMPGFGPYWGGPPKNSTTGANDVANDPFWGPLGIRWISYCSTDHDSEGGIWLSVSTAADPKVPSSWRTYDQALAAGLFCVGHDQAVEEPIFKHGAGLSIETPHVIKIGDDWAMFYQTYSVNGSVNQCTNRVLSADGLNWSGPRTAPWLIVPAGTVLGNLGDGHTGYARMAPNIFSRSAIPYDWLIASLFGGGDICLFAQWGCNDPTRGRATFIQTLSPQHGRPGMEAGL